MAPTKLRITVFENGVPFNPSGYSGQELQSLLDTIEELWSPTYHSTRFFRVDQDDDDVLWLVYVDSETRTLHPIPEEWMTKTARFGVKTTLAYVGDRIPIAPRQYGLSPWPASVHVLFTTD